jgi:hypothetical protein
MNCRHAQRAISALMDGAHLPASERGAVESHVAGCAACRSFADGSVRVRTAVRIRSAEAVPDLTDQIMARVAGAPAPSAFTAVRRGRPVRGQRFLPLVAAVVAGLLVGSTLVGGPWASRSQTATASEIVQAIRRAAPSIDAFQGSFQITERGLAPDVPVRELSMDVAFLAPQRFRLDVRDATAYPNDAWTPTNIDYVEDMPATSLSGPTGCPGSLPPTDCPPTRETVTRSTPYSAAAPLPADLIAPIATFGTVDGVRIQGEETVDGHDTVRATMSFARAEPLFSFLRLGGTWRPFFAGDLVTVWLDATGWYPVRIEVTPSPDPERRSWEMRFGLPHEPLDEPILLVELVSVSSTAPDPSVFAIPGLRSTRVAPADAAQVLGYAPVTPSSTGQLSLASVVAPRSGTSPSSVLVYADGLDYLRIGEDPSWSGAEPFGSIGADAQRVALPGVGPALYAPAADGVDRRLAIHAANTDLYLESNLPRDELLAISSSLNVRAGQLPRAWRIHRSGTLTIERVSPDTAVADLGVSGVISSLPPGYVPVAATRTIERGAVAATAVTFRRLDTETAGSSITLQQGHAVFSSAPDQVRVQIGARTAATYDPGGSVLTWTDHGRSWSIQGDVGFARLVTVATAVLAETSR